MLTRSKIARPLRHSLPIGLAVLVLGAGLQAHAVPLDDQYDSLLSSDCASFGTLTYTTTGIGLVPNELTGGLQTLCTILFVPPNPPGVSTSGGGGAGQLTTQTSLAGLTLSTRRAQETDEKKSRAFEEVDAGPLGVAGSSDAGEVEWKGVFGAWDAFTTLEFDARNRDQTKFEDGFDSYDWNVLVGADRRFGGTHFAGLALQYARVDGDFDAGGGFERDTAGFVAYGGYRLTDGLLATADLSYAHGWDDLERRVQGQFNFINVKGDIKSRTHNDRVGSRLALEQSFYFDRYTISGRAGAIVDWVQIDDTVERGRTGLELRIDEREKLSVRSQLAASVSGAFSLPFGAIVPQLEVEYIHEFEDDQESIRATFVDDLTPSPNRFAFETDSPDRDFVNLRASVVLSLGQRIRPYAQFRTILGNEYLESYGGSVGVRISLRN